jgi:hypothetical protein
MSMEHPHQTQILASLSVKRQFLFRFTSTGPKLPTL